MTCFHAKKELFIVKKIPVCNSSLLISTRDCREAELTRVWGSFHANFGFKSCITGLTEDSLPVILSSLIENADCPPSWYSKF